MFWVSKEKVTNKKMLGFLEYIQLLAQICLLVGVAVGWTDGWIVGVFDGFSVGFSDGAIVGFLEGITGNRCARKETKCAFINGPTLFANHKAKFIETK